VWSDRLCFDAVRRTLILVCAIVCYETMFFTVLAPLLPHFEQRFGLSVAGSGVLTATYAAGALVGAVPSGLLVTRIGIKATVLGGLVLLASASIAFGLAPDAPLVFVARLAQGCGCALAWTGGLAWLVAQTPEDRRGEAIGVAFGAAVAGALLGPALGALADFAGTRSVFVALAAPGFALAVWGATMPDGPRELISLSTFRHAFTRRSLLAPALFIVLAGFLLGVMSVLAPLRLASLGWGASGIAAIFVLSAGAQTLLNPLLGRWTDRRGAAPPLQFGLALSALASVGLAIDLGRWGYAAIALVANIAFGLLVTPGVALLSLETTKLSLGFATGFALLNVAWPPGQLAGAAGGGVVAQATSNAVPYLIAGALCLAGLGLSLQRERSGRASDLRLPESHPPT
jgi:DHA1 family solute carrier family 18 vesicular amine transporter 1/2